MTIRKYPLSAGNGRPIPMEVLGPIRSSLAPLTNVFLPTNLYVPDYEDIIYLVYCAENVILAWAETDTVIDGTTQPSVIIPALTWANIAPPFAYVNAATDVTPKVATLLINVVERWDTLSTPIQIDQG